MQNKKFENLKLSLKLRAVLILVFGYISLSCISFSDKQDKDLYIYATNYSKFNLQPIDKLTNTFDLTFCDRLKLAINDISNDFKLFKGDFKFEDDEKIVYNSKYSFNEYNIEIHYDKQDKSYTLAIETFNGLNVDDANLIFERDRESIISCLPNYSQSELSQVKLTETLTYTSQDFTSESNYVSSVVYQTLESHKIYGKTVRFRAVIEIYRF